MSEKSTTTSDKEAVDNQATLAARPDTTAAATITTSAGARPKRHATSQWLAGIAGVLVVLIVIGLVSGRLYAGFKNSSDKVMVGPAICDDASVSEFNKLAQQDLTQSSGLKTFIEKLEQQPAASHDATCAYMAFYYYQATGNIAKAKQYYNTVASLNKQGHYPNNKIGDLMNLTIMSDTIQVLQSKQANPTNNGRALGSG